LDPPEGGQPIQLNAANMREQLTTKLKEIGKDLSMIDHICGDNAAVNKKLFSRAKLIMTNNRKRMSPENLNALLFLRYNRNEEIIQDLIDKFEVNVGQEVEPAEVEALPFD
jgi:hypothetical protein